MSDLGVYERQNFGKTLGFGRRAGLLVIDFVNGFVDPEVFGGGNIGTTLANTLPVLDAARAAGLPVAFARIVYADDGSDAGVFARKVPGLLGLTEAAAISQVADEVAPRQGELIVRKTQAPAFFGTGLAPWFTGNGVDTVLIAG